MKKKLVTVLAGAALLSGVAAPAAQAQAADSTAGSATSALNELTAWWQDLTGVNDGYHEPSWQRIATLSAVNIPITLSSALFLPAIWLENMLDR